MRNYPESSPSFSTLTQKWSTVGSALAFLRPGKHWQINPDAAFNVYRTYGLEIITGNLFLEKNINENHKSTCMFMCI